MEVLQQESFSIEARKLKVYMNWAMLYIMDNLREIEKGAETEDHPELFERTNTVLEEIFYPINMSPDERLRWLGQGIDFLRGSFMAANYVPVRGEEYVVERPLQAALYRDLLVQWSRTYRQVNGERSKRSHFTNFEAMLLRRFETADTAKPRQTYIDKIDVAQIILNGKLLPHDSTDEPIMVKS